MHKFTSKPVQITETLVLCEDGSIWEADNGLEWSQVASYEKPIKKMATMVKPAKPSAYTEEFSYFWSIWAENIMNTSNKQSSFKSFQVLSKDEKTALVYSVPLYAKTEPRETHRYLKRCETYINQKHWEAVVADAPKPPKEEVINRGVNLEGSF